MCKSSCHLLSLISRTLLSLSPMCALLSLTRLPRRTAIEPTSTAVEHLQLLLSICYRAGNNIGNHFSLDQENSSDPSVIIQSWFLTLSLEVMIRR